MCNAERLRFWSALLILAAGRAASGEPSGGTGNGTNPVVPLSSYEGRELPWPEPDARAVEILSAEMRAQLPAAEFRTLRVGPWLIATDLDAEGARRFAGSTIASFAARIQKQLFTRRPRSEPVKVLLFKDGESYAAWNQKLFQEPPGTPYGYYSRTRKALVMNIGTGGGTLLHEMVHAMAEADFPALPAWLNEGLGSLFEASSEDRRGKVLGIANWRLKGLQEDLKRGTATRVAELLRMDNAEFYGAKSGSHYAAARYLMQYLQEQGHLEEFYTRVRDGKDASADAALRAVFGDKLSVDEIETACWAWVKTLVAR